MNCSKTGDGVKPRKEKERKEVNIMLFKLPLII